jgi:hypothetical protein
MKALVPCGAAVLLARFRTIAKREKVANMPFPPDN